MIDLGIKGGGYGGINVGNLGGRISSASPIIIDPNLPFEERYKLRIEQERQRRQSVGLDTGEGWASPQWLEQLRNEMLAEDSQRKLEDLQNPQSGSGLDYKYFADILKNYIATGDPNLSRYKQSLYGDVNRSFDKGATTLRENLAGSGMLRSGAGQNAFATLEGGRTGAISEANTQLAAQDQAFRQGALQNLLGVFGQETSWKEFLMNLLTNQNQFTAQNRLQSDQFEFGKGQSKFNFWRDLLPGLIGAGGQVGAAYAGKGTGGTKAGAGAGAGMAGMAMSDIKVKKNIKYIGISKEGIPIIEFNYINNDDNRYRGVLAHDVEKIKPWAVIEIDGIKMVDYTKIDVPFEVIR